MAPNNLLRKFLASVLILVGWGTPSVLGELPNIIVILVDDIGAECFNSYGGVSYVAPNINRLAAEGMQFNNFYSQPKCTHTRMELLTGKYNSRNYVGFETMGTPQFSIADLLTLAGYKTCVVGKWQLGYPFIAEDPRVEVTPQHVGFSESHLWVDFAAGLANFFDGAVVHSNRHFSMPRDARISAHRQGYGPNIMNRLALRFIEENHDSTAPFFLYYSMRLPHGPFCPPPGHADFPAWEEDDIKYFPSMVTHMDKLVGRVLDKVSSLEIEDNTLIIFLSDNGTNRRISSQLSDGTVVNGGKGKPNVREGMHVPFLAKWDGKIQAGSQSNAIADSTDLMATIADITGVDTPAGMDGKTLYDDMQQIPGPDKWRRYSHYPRHFDITDVTTAAFTRQFKLHRKSNGVERYYDILADPLEASPLNTNQLTGQQQTVYDKLRDVVTRYDTIGNEFDDQ